MTFSPIITQVTFETNRVRVRFFVFFFLYNVFLEENIDKIPSLPSIN